MSLEEEREKEREKMPFIVATYVYARSQGQRTHSARTKSVLDFFVVCTRVLPHITKMVIDEEKKFILTNYKNARNGAKAIDTDHFTEYMDVNLQIITEKPERREI